MWWLFGALSRQVTPVTFPCSHRATCIFTIVELHRGGSQAGLEERTGKDVRLVGIAARGIFTSEPDKWKWRKPICIASGR